MLFAFHANARSRSTITLTVRTRCRQDIMHMSNRMFQWWRCGNRKQSHISRTDCDRESLRLTRNL